MKTPHYAVVEFGCSGVRTKVFRNIVTAKQSAASRKGRGTCSVVRIYACESRSMARTADISVVRTGEQIVYSV